MIERLFDTVYSAIKIAGPAKVSNSVRVSKYKTVFEKGYTSNWTTEVFTIGKAGYQSRIYSRKKRLYYRGEWLALPTDTPNVYIHAGVKDGGLGIAFLRWYAPLRRLERLRRLPLANRLEEDAPGTFLRAQKSSAVPIGLKTAVRKDCQRSTCHQH